MIKELKISSEQMAIAVGHYLNNELFQDDYEVEVLAVSQDYYGDDFTVVIGTKVKA